MIQKSLIIKVILDSLLEECVPSFTPTTFDNLDKNLEITGDLLQPCTYKNVDALTK